MFKARGGHLLCKCVGRDVPPKGGPIFRVCLGRRYIPSYKFWERAQIYLSGKGPCLSGKGLSSYLCLELESC